MSTIAFTRGVPSADLLPVDDLKRAVIEALELDAAGALAYAPSGYLGLREWIGERHGVAPSRVVLFNGSLEGVGMLIEHMFAAEGGAAVVEDPTYDRSLIALRRHGAEVVPVPLEADGVDVDGVRSALDQHPSARMIYVIPTFQNPAGVTLSRDKRTALVALAQEREVLLVEDDPYGLLRFEGEADPTPVRARRRRQRRLLVVVHQDRGPGAAHRLPGAARAAGGADRKALHQHLHRAQRVCRSDARGLLPRRPVRAQRGICHRGSQDPSRCDGAGAARVVPGWDALDDPGGRLLLLDRVARGISRPPRCSRQRPRPACRSCPARISPHARSAPARCGWRSAR